MLDDIQIEKEDQSIRDKFKKLKEQLKKCQKEKEEYLLGWQRAKADFINARHEEEKKREKVVLFANQSIIYDLLTSIDNFDLALKETEKDSQINKKDNIIKGFYLIKLQIDDIFKKHGLEQIKAVGEQFDPKFHEALAEVAVPSAKGGKSGVITEEIQKGYLFNGEVLRPARVKIIK